MSDTIEIQKLSSGLTLVMAPTPSESLTVLSLVRAGSRDEVKGQFGAAHFLEHFVFKGTKKYPKTNDVTKIVDALGGRQNAFTWTDFTGFWVKLAKSHMETAVDVVSQLVVEPLFPEAELEKEKGTILEEIHMYEDQLPAKAWHEFEDLLFPDSPLGRPILGTEESIKAMKVADLKAFWSGWYRPENAIVVLAGGLDSTQNARKLVEQKFAPLGEQKNQLPRVNYGQVFTQDQPRVRITNRKAKQAHLVLGSRTFGATDADVPVLAVLSTILGGNMSSRLWDEVREKRGLAYYIRSGFDARIDNGTFTVRAGVRLKDAPEAVKLIRSELLKVADKGVTTEELQMGKEAIKGNFKLDMEDSMEVAEHLADDWATRDGQIDTSKETLEKIDEVTKDQVKEVAAKVFDPNSFNLSLIGPFKSEEPFRNALER